MSGTWKTVRVFISSTFRDMQAERDWLVKRVFPDLRERLSPYRIYLVEVDLRWGITREQAESGQVLDFCLQQIDECRPYFLGMLGERYGSIPEEVAAEIEQEFGAGRSVTDLEILYGALQNRNLRARALFALRSPDFLAEMDECSRLDFIEEEGRREKLIELKERIRDLIPVSAIYDGYPCGWDSQVGRVTDLAAFGSWVLQKLEAAILLDHGVGATASFAGEQSFLEEEQNAAEALMEERTRTFAGRKYLLSQLHDFSSGSGFGLCVVSGASGSGKSALMAQFTRELAQQLNGGIPVIWHFVGASPRSVQIRSLLGHLCEQLESARGLASGSPGERWQDWARRFRDLLRDGPCVVVIDGLDQLDEEDQAHQLSWLPQELDLPHPVRIIVSCLSCSEREETQVRRALRSRPKLEVSVSPLNPDERRQILREVPLLAAKTLDELQSWMLLSNPATESPLFLLVALEELRGVGDIDELDARIASLPRPSVSSGNLVSFPRWQTRLNRVLPLIETAVTENPLTALYRQVIGRLQKDFEPATVRDLLGYVIYSRQGVSQRELLDLLEGPTVGISASTSDLFPILRQLREHLVSRGELFGAFHRHLALSVEETWPAEEFRRRLADYFAQTGVPNQRQVAEAPWLYRKAGLHDRLWGLIERKEWARKMMLESDFPDCLRWLSARLDFVPEIESCLRTWQLTEADVIFLDRFGHELGTSMTRPGYLSACAVFQEAIRISQSAGQSASPLMMHLGYFHAKWGNHAEAQRWHQASFISEP